MIVLPFAGALENVTSIFVSSLELTQCVAAALELIGVTSQYEGVLGRSWANENDVVVPSPVALTSLDVRAPRPSQWNF